jgi:transcriptional regulator with XRE-family HTH domain/mannose-6-phosphate isomerase-like protein (cupin superfamily)
MKRKRKVAALKKETRPSHKLGAKIREARLGAKMKLRELGSRSGLSESLLSRIENGKATPSIGSLHDISVALGINLSWFFDEDRDRHGPVVLRKGQRQIIRYRSDGSMMENFVPFGDTHVLQGFLLTVEPGGHNKETRKHTGEEMGYMLAGELELTVSGSVYRLKAGDSFNFRSEEAHSYRNPGKRNALLVWVNTPPTM